MQNFSQNNNNNSRLHQPSPRSLTSGHSEKPVSASEASGREAFQHAFI